MGAFTLIVFTLLMFLIRFPSFLKWIHENPGIGIAVFIPLEILWIVIGLPITPLELGCGLVYGLYGLIINTVGKLLGCVTAFLLGRSCLRSYVERNFSHSHLIHEIDRALSQNRWSSIRLLLLIQLSYVPIALKNYGVSLTNVSLFSFTWTSLVGEFLGTCATVLAGSSAADIVKVAHGKEPMTSLQVVALSISVFSSVVFVLIMCSYIPRAMKTKEGISLSHLSQDLSNKTPDSSTECCLEEDRTTDFTQIYEASEDQVILESALSPLNEGDIF